MFYVYVLQSLTYRKLYIGYSADLKKRIKSHLTNNVYTTKRMGELRLIYYEAHLNKNDALKREKYFKTTKGKRSLKIMLSGVLK